MLFKYDKFEVSAGIPPPSPRQDRVKESYVLGRTCNTNASTCQCNRNYSKIRWCCRSKVLAPCLRFAGLITSSEVRKKNWAQTYLLLKLRHRNESHHNKYRMEMSTFAKFGYVTLHSCKLSNISQSPYNKSPRIHTVSNFSDF